MNQLQITKDQLLAIQAFKIGFASKLYSNYLDEFIANVNIGIAVDVKVVIRQLIGIAVENCGISTGARTVAFDYANAVLTAHPTLWKEDEESEFGVNILDYWSEFSSEDFDNFMEYDITCMSEGEYFVLAVSMLSEDIRVEYVPAFSYATYIFFRDYYSSGVVFGKSEEENLLQVISVAEEDFRRNNELE